MASQTAQPGDGSSGVDRYRMAWIAVNGLLREGRSWSGHERNNAYLNLPGAVPMANISAVSGLDFADDGRGLAVSDWDGDGDLDLWTTNRSSPAVRFLRNESGSRSPSLTLRLQGVSCNRNAVGARVSLTTQNGILLIRSVSAGDAFLSQSTRDLVFGFPPGDPPVTLTVRWPGDAEEAFTEFSDRGRFLLVQGSGKARPLDPVPESQPHAASQLDPKPASSQARIPLLSRFPLPLLHPSAENGQTLTVGAPGEPLLIVLWAEWCQPCLSELQALQAHSGELASAGLRMLALSVDEVSESPSPDTRSKSLSAARRTGITFPLAWATPSDLEILEVLQRTLIETHLPLPLPSSFLLDSTGRVACIYKGPVEPQQLRSDLEFLDANTDALLEIASPLTGRRTRKPAPLGPIQLALKLYEGGYSQLTRDYLRQLIEIAETRAPGHEVLDRAPLHYFMGTLLEEAGRPQDAIHAYRFALRAEPNHIDAHRNLGQILLKNNQPAEALPHLEAACRDLPAPDPLNHELARAYYQTGRTAEALPLLRALADSSGASPDALRLLIWILSTGPDAAVRNAKEALRLSEALLAKAGSDPDTATLSFAAAAAAENGDTARAETLARQALERAAAAPRSVKQRLEAQIQSYSAGQPWRELEP